MQHLNNYSTKSILLFAWIILCTCLNFEPTQAKTKSKTDSLKTQEKLIDIRLDAQEAQIVLQLMQKIELSTQELTTYLDICKKLEQITTHQHEPPKKVVLSLSTENAKNLILFIQRASIPSLGAKQVDAILKKIQNSLTKEQPKNKAANKSDRTLDLQLSITEIQVLLQMLDQIDIAIVEVEPFLEAYLPIEQGIKQDRKAKQEVTIKLPDIGPKNLLIFLERTTVAGTHAKDAYSVIDKLQHAIETKPALTIAQP